MYSLQDVVTAEQEPVAQVPGAVRIDMVSGHWAAEHTVLPG
jgi:hypothetical protein